MTLKQAREIGKACGLETDEECIRNIEIHCTNLFKYSEIMKELNELYADRDREERNEK